MTVKRDYGSFAKATRRLLPPLVAPHGYADDGRGLFVRDRGQWLEAFALQQTQYGDGSFCINMGIVVPGTAARWLNPESTGFDLGFRLSERGVDQGDAWLPAADRVQLDASLGTLASWLPGVDPWFAQFRTMADIAREYLERRPALKPPGENGWMATLTVANYGFLLAEAGDVQAARTWLREAERLMSLPMYTAKGWAGVMHEKVKGARLMKPTPDEIRQLEAVRASLRGLEAVAAG